MNLCIHAVCCLIASPRNSSISVHLQGVQRLLRLVYWVHHEFIYLPVDEDMGSASVVIWVLELAVLSCVVALLVLLVHVI